MRHDGIAEFRHGGSRRKPEPAISPEIRIATTDDLAGMVSLLAQLFAIEADFNADPAKQAAGLRLLLQNSTAQVWVASRHGHVVGMITLQILISTAEGGRVGLIEDLVVTEAWRSQGLGRRLLATAEAWAEQQGLCRLHLLADRENRLALDFYRRRGWQATQLIALRKFGR